LALKVPAEQGYVADIDGLAAKVGSSLEALRVSGGAAGDK
jgi:hypothetical protein